MRQTIRHIGLLLFSVLVCLPALAANDLKHHRDIVWASPDGHDLHLDIAVPQTATEAKPVLVIFHGGGWLINDKSIMNDLAETVPRRADIITVNVDYRLLPDRDNTVTINEIVEDAMGATLWVKDNIHRYGGDPQQIAVTGDSAGGHLAAMVTLAGRNLGSDGFNDKTQRFTPTYLPDGRTAEQVAEEDGLKVQAAILSYAAFSMLEAAQGNFESADNPFWGWADAEARGIFGNERNVNDHSEYYQAVSAAPYLVSADEYPLPPQFVHVGENDDVTPPESARAYVDRLTELGQHARLVIYDDLGHGFLDTGCNDYTGGCFEDLAEETVKDMVAFLEDVFEL
ncbi:alpha/beta hydrolase [Marinimicrobium alkaliphilum]|uniref:alpha/beta hydrolase n=1 Tax=Marinimicrobium alkaliphilum TaxID=2202654 RepID=UPI000DB99977|nr:alpha/beta hydrolase [Marinimicrobium alkaliphilum]